MFLALSSTNELVERNCLWRPTQTKLKPKHLIGWPEKMNLTSRRSVLFSAAIIPAVALCNSARAVGADVVLVALGQRFDALAAQIDHSIDHGSDIVWQALDEAVLISGDSRYTRYHYGGPLRKSAGRVLGAVRRFGRRRALVG